MGYRVSWIARLGTSATELLEASRRLPTGERHDFPDIGWYLFQPSSPAAGPCVILIAMGTGNYDQLNCELAQSLSRNGHETCYFWCSDTCMSTVLICFKNGVEAWSIYYNCDGSSKRPAIVGQVPQVTYELLNELERQQAAADGCDYLYELTANVGRELFGFRHDDASASGNDDPFESGNQGPFQVLSERIEQRPPWWQFWKR